MTTRTITCPKCGFEQCPSKECVRCGIIFHKFNKNSNAAGKIDPAANTTKRNHPGGTWRLTIRIVRIFMLLVILFIVGMSAWLTKLRTTDWDEPLRVIVFPINGDNSSAANDYIESLKVETFQSVVDFMQQEAEHYELQLPDPVTVILAPPVDEVPPQPPQSNNMLSVVWWSLKMRYWAYCIDTSEGVAADVKMFIVYFNPKEFERLSDSLGLQKGLIGVVYAFAERRFAEKDNIVFAHELLHTVGAKDKYDFSTKQPLYPDGYADPEHQPLYPQEIAEIMATRIPLSKDNATMPKSLDEVVIGPKTAQEIQWFE